jgi:hypothetical protein
MSAEGDLVQLMAGSVFEVLDNSGRRSADAVAEGVVSDLKEDSRGDEFGGWLIRAGVVYRVKCCEHEFEDEDDQGPFTVWTFSTHKEPDGQAG